MDLARPRGSQRRRGSPGAFDLLAVGVGGIVGTALRAGVTLAFPAAPGQIRWATAGVNVIGAFAMGVLVIRLVRDRPDSERLRLFLLTGVLGSFTTFSAFAVEIVELAAVHAQAPGAALYVFASVAGGLLAAMAGLRVGDRGRPRRGDAGP